MILVFCFPASYKPVVWNIEQALGSSVGVQIFGLVLFWPFTLVGWWAIFEMFLMIGVLAYTIAQIACMFLFYRVYYHLKNQFLLHLFANSMAEVLDSSAWLLNT